MKRFLSYHIYINGQRQYEGALTLVSVDDAGQVISEQYSHETHTTVYTEKKIYITTDSSGKLENLTFVDK